MHLDNHTIFADPMNSSTLGYMSHVCDFTLLLLEIFESSTIDIANYIYEHPTALDLDLQGIWIADRNSFF
jgi:hypothetical protein